MNNQIAKPSFSKIDENTIQVEKVIPETTETNTYDYDFLLSQRDAIQKQADDFAAARQVELDEINGMIDQADSLGIVAKPVEELLRTSMTRN